MNQKYCIQATEVHKYEYSNIFTSTDRRGALPLHGTRSAAHFSEFARQHVSHVHRTGPVAQAARARPETLCQCIAGLVSTPSVQGVRSNAFTTDTRFYRFD